MSTCILPHSAKAPESKPVILSFLIKMFMILAFSRFPPTNVINIKSIFLNNSAKTKYTSSIERRSIVYICCLSAIENLR